MENMPACPNCKENFTYVDGDNYVCPMCAHEWQDEVVEERVWKDCNGAVLANGDSVSVIKELKINGGPKSIKQGTRVKNIRLIDGDDGHDISCKIDGFGAMNLKSEFVKKI